MAGAFGLDVPAMGRSSAVDVPPMAGTSRPDVSAMGRTSTVNVRPSLKKFRRNRLWVMVVVGGSR